ncbi:RidA family protein [Actinomycetospora termitidis]|uniref:RidA family protein n=1 Tax=Actinomycetospora termitidis TaxID=3053470 RepID=A0ABT7M5B8_9PSEU|nr:RidA family protein [Actinomycetospora sp. Odt1-22]MDL5155865.1 RidA family protein [Actinomycetospora sp. Odt1-22]
MTNTEVDRTIRINPTTWNQGFAYDQAQLRPAPVQLLTVAGQGSIDADGSLLHADDMAAQMALAMGNVEDLLERAAMDLRDVLRLTVYVTDMDAALGAYRVLVERLTALGATPPATLVEVSRLAVPGMCVEINATAGR